MDSIAVRRMLLAGYPLRFSEVPDGCGSQTLPQSLSPEGRGCACGWRRNSAGCAQDTALCCRSSTQPICCSDQNTAPVLSSCVPVRFNPASGDTSEMELLLRYSQSSCVNPAKADISEIELFSRSSPISCVNPASGDTSEMELLLRYSIFSCVNPASGDTSEMELLLRYSVFQLCQPRQDRYIRKRVAPKTTAKSVVSTPPTQTHPK